MKKLKTLLLTLSSITLACVTFSFCSLTNEGAKAATNEYNMMDIDCVHIEDKGTASYKDKKWYGLDYTIPSNASGFGYQITIENFSYDESNSTSSYHQIMSSYNESTGGGYLFTSHSSSFSHRRNLCFQIGSDQVYLEKGYNPVSVKTKNTIRVDVDIANKKFSIHDTLGYMDITNKSFNGAMPTGSQICLAYNCSFDLYECRIWEVINNEEVEQVDMVPVAYYDEEEDTLVTGIYDSVTNVATYDTVEEKSELDDFASVTYWNGNEVLARKAFVIGKVDTTIMEGPEIKGKIFDGWYNAQTGGTKVTAIPNNLSGNMNVYAHYLDVMHNVTYKNGDAIIAVNGATQFAENDGLDLSSIVPATNPTGMKFVGWYDAKTDGKLVTSIDAGTETDVTLYANFVYSEDAFIDEFLNAGLCDNGVHAPSKTLWQSLANEFANLGTTEQELFKFGVADENGDNIAQCLARYDYIIGKYGKQNYSDFMNRNPEQMANPNQMAFDKEAQESSSVVIVSLLGLSTIIFGGFYFTYRKKKHQ